MATPALADIIAIVPINEFQMEIPTTFSAK
jgi:hypothetical protein